MTTRQPRVLSILLAALSVSACANVEQDNVEQDIEMVSRAEQALNVCNAVTSSNLSVDGIPAYAQCPDSTNASIYSNNGVDTATTAVASDWKQTQRSGGYQCTELVHRYWLFRWNVTWLPNGNAGTWCNTLPPTGSGIVQTTTPVHGDAIVFAPGVCGASSTYGHVALVDTVDLAGQKVTIVEQNAANRRTSAWSCASCFLHVVANTMPSGTGGTGGAIPIGGTSSMGKGGATSTGGTSSVGKGGMTSNGGAGFAGQGGATSTGGLAAGGGATKVGETSVGGAISTTLGGATNIQGGGTSTGGRTTSAATMTVGGTTMITTANSTLGGSAVHPPSNTTDSDTEADAGCGCRISGESSRPNLPFWAGLVLLLAARKRRKHRGSVRLSLDF